MRVLRYAYTCTVGIGDLETIGSGRNLTSSAVVYLAGYCRIPSGMHFAVDSLARADHCHDM